MRTLTLAAYTHVKWGGGEKEQLSQCGKIWKLIVHRDHDWCGDSSSDSTNKLLKLAYKFTYRVRCRGSVHNNLQLCGNNHEMIVFVFEFVHFIERIKHKQ